MPRMNFITCKKKKKKRHFINTELLLLTYVLAGECDYQ